MKIAPFFFSFRFQQWMNWCAEVVDCFELLWLGKMFYMKMCYSFQFPSEKETLSTMLPNKWKWSNENNQKMILFSHQFHPIILFRSQYYLLVKELILILFFSSLPFSFLCRSIYRSKINAGVSRKSAIQVSRRLWEW